MQSTTSGTVAALKGGTLDAKVSAAIAAEAGVNAFDITPKSNNGIVTLTGHVPDERIHTTVLDTVRKVPGVKGVVDHLKVRAVP